MCQQQEPVQESRRTASRGARLDVEEKAFVRRQHIRQSPHMPANRAFTRVLTTHPWGAGLDVDDERVGGPILQTPLLHAVRGARPQRVLLQGRRVADAPRRPLVCARGRCRICDDSIPQAGFRATCWHFDLNTRRVHEVRRRKPRPRCGRRSLAYLRLVAARLQAPLARQRPLLTFETKATVHVASYNC